MHEDIVYDLDIDSFKLFKVNYGEFDTLGLYASYNLTFDEFSKILSEMPPDKSLPEAVKTKFHELTHLFQMTSTPFGYYMYLLDEFQNDRVEAIAYQLKQKYKFRIKYPLIELIKGLDKKKYYEVWFNVYLWFAAEYVKLFFTGDVDKYLKQGAYNTMLGAYPIIEHIAILDFYLADSYNRKGGHISYDKDNLKIDKTSFLQQHTLSMLKTVGKLDVNAMLESWAKVAEYWTQDKNAVNTIYSDTPKTYSKSNQVSYYWMIHQFSDGKRIKNRREFVFTYMALCELSLFGLLPPHLAGLRKLEETNLGSLHPLRRFVNAIGVFAKHNIAPIRNLTDDYTRFMNEICAKLNWVAPGQVVDHCSHDAKYVNENMHDRLFYHAQFVRKRLPGFFLDFDMWLNPKNMQDYQLTIMFDHPIIKYADKEKYHKDKYWVTYSVMNYITKQYYRKMFLSKDLSVTIPFNANQGGLEYFGDILKTRLKYKLGVENPTIDLKSQSQLNGQPA